MLLTDVCFVFCCRLEKASVVNQVGWYSKVCQTVTKKLVCWIEGGKEEEEELRGGLWMIFVVEGLVGRELVAEGMQRRDREKLTHQIDENSNRVQKEKHVTAGRIRGVRLRSSKCHR